MAECLMEPAVSDAECCYSRQVGFDFGALFGRCLLAVARAPRHVDWSLNPTDYPAPSVPEDIETLPLSGHVRAAMLALRTARLWVLERAQLQSAAGVSGVVAEVWAAKALTTSVPSPLAVDRRVPHQSPGRASAPKGSGWRR